MGLRLGCSRYASQFSSPHALQRRPSIAHSPSTAHRSQHCRLRVRRRRQWPHGKQPLRAQRCHLRLHCLALRLQLAIPRPLTSQFSSRLHHGNEPFHIHGSLNNCSKHIDQPRLRWPRSSWTSKPTQERGEYKWNELQHSTHELPGPTSRRRVPAPQARR